MSVNKSDRIEYAFLIVINLHQFKRVVIDQHYRKNHSESVSDQIILELMGTLHRRGIEVESEKNGFLYFTVEPIFHPISDDPYRVMFLFEQDKDYLGVVNVFRVNRR